MQPERTMRQAPVQIDRRGDDGGLGHDERHDSGNQESQHVWISFTAVVVYWP